MASRKLITRQALALLAPVALLACAWAAEDDDAVRKRLLALNDVTGTTTIEGHIKTLAADKDKTKQLLTLADRMARGKEKDSPFNYNAAYILARVAQDLHDLEVSRLMFRICADQARKLQSGEKLAQSYGGLIDLFYEHKKFDETVKICQEFLELIELRKDDELRGMRGLILERMILALARQGKFDDSLKLADNAIAAEEEGKGKGNAWYFVRVKGLVLREADRFADAAKAYETALERIEKDKTIKEEEQRALYIERTRYVLSNIYIDLQQIDKAIENLEALRKAKPDDPTYNNDLGYIMADHNKGDLAKAEVYIRKAIEEDRKQRKANPDLTPDEDKDNAAYLDSLGWVLFRQKKYEEAKKYLLQAVADKEGRHIEIYDHLGDVHLALNEKEQALGAFKKGLETAGKSKREQERKLVVEKKIKDLQP